MVGDIGPGGGIVFYVSLTPFASSGSTCGNNCRYLEAAPTDSSAGIQWCSDQFNALGTSATAIGSGMSNTSSADSTCTSGAIQIAADYSNNGKSDWHLPSKDELNALYLERATVGGFASAAYHSSSEASPSLVVIQYMNNGAVFNSGKNRNDFRVRVVRAF